MKNKKSKKIIGAVQRKKNNKTMDYKFMRKNGMCTGENNKQKNRDT